MNPLQYLLYAGAFVLVIFSVVVIHEAGHFVVGKLSGIRVDEFSVGFGPKLLSRQRGETTYSLRAIPAGGYVRMAGMLGLAGEADAGERNFYRAGIPRRFATIAAGVVSNFIFAALCFTVVNMAPTSSFVAAHSPAATAGLQNGASILSIDGRTIRHDTPEDVQTDLRAATVASQGRPMTVVYRSPDGSTRTTTVKPLLVMVNVVSGRLPVGDLVITSINGMPVGTGDPATLLGNGSQVFVSAYAWRSSSDWSMGQSFNAVNVSGVKTGYGARDSLQVAWRIGVGGDFNGQPFPAALASGVTAIPAFIHDTVAGIYQLVTVPSLGGVTGPNGFSGPVGIAEQTVTATNNGLLGRGGLVFWIGFISMNLGFINMLPIPFLDGGKLLFLGIEAVRRKRLDPRHEAIASAVGLALVLVFVVYVTIGDVGRI